MKRIAVAGSVLFAGLGCLAGPTKTTALILAATEIVPGHFLVPGGITSDKFYVYCATSQGSLVVLDKSKKGFPVAATVNVCPWPLRSVRRDADHIFLTDVAGILHVLQGGRPFTEVASVQLWTLGGGLDCLFVDETQVIVAAGQANVAADASLLCLAQVNQGDCAFVLDKETLNPISQFGAVYDPVDTRVFSRSTGGQLAAVPYPVNSLGQENRPFIALQNGVLIQTIPGPFGTGVTFAEAATGGTLGFLPWDFANVAVELHSGMLAVGTEAGTVAIFDTDRNLVSMLNLRELTRGTAADAVEVRSLWEDSWTGDIYAGSTWNYPSIPSFFVLQVVTKPQPAR